jgi:chromosome segregation ATPase
MADDSAKAEKARQEAAGLKAQLSDCPKVKHDLANLERELATMTGKMREFRGLKAAMADQQQRHEQEICDVKHEVELLQKASDSQRESREREAKAVVECERSLGSWRATLRICDQKTVTIGQESGKLPERTSSRGWRPVD